MTAGLLAGKRAAITGAARGLGAAIGRGFEAEGARVAALDLPEALGRPAAYRGSIATGCDVALEAEVAAGLADAARALGGLDVVVANAGIVPPWRETEALDLAEWDHVMAVNARGVAVTIKHAVPHLKDRGGSIILMASINASVSHPCQMLYTASKHAVLGIMKAAALDLGRYGVRVNALAPGPIATQALIDRLEARAQAGGLSSAAALDDFATATPLKRMATADDVAKVACFLASDLSSGVTGRMLPVDAGLVA